MENATQIATELKTTDENTVVEVSTRYSAGYDDTGESQGYWVYINISNASRPITVYSGIKIRIQPAKRFIADKLHNIHNNVMSEIKINHADNRMPQVLRMALQNANVELAEGQIANGKRAEEYAQRAKEYAENRTQA